VLRNDCFEETVIFIDLLRTTANAAQETTKVTFPFGRLNDRYGEFGAAVESFRTTARDVGIWSMPGAHFDEVAPSMPLVDPQLPVASEDKAHRKYFRMELLYGCQPHFRRECQ